MKHHFVSAIAKAVMRMQYRFILIGLKAPALRFFRAQQPPKLDDLFARPACALTLYSLHQCAIAQEEVVTGKWRNLIRGLLVADGICRVSKWLCRLRADLSGGSRHGALIMNYSQPRGTTFVLWDCWP